MSDLPPTPVIGELEFRLSIQSGNSLGWTDWCCLACRRLRRTTNWVAWHGKCSHIGTQLEQPFWAHGGEPNQADIVDGEARHEAAAAEERMLQEVYKDVS